ncbi:cobyric acid synthase [Bacteroides mediterraneensis]|uniref:cobyric acid synthase n=1 Tax=Bacteroides mediterraneensis TaxID=1841856 RepID=UPI0026EC016E|nr:cobyric acid synthase [Bacteroides mediterraneensis]
MKVYLVRHTSVDVPSGTCYGQTDVPLRASFEEEAAVCREAIRRIGIDFTRVYASPLSRCMRLAAYCGFPDAERDDRLKEMHMGEWEMQRFDEITDPRIQEWYQDYLRVRTTGGESFMDVLARVSDFLDHLNRTSGPVLIFAHGGVLVAAQVYAGKVKLEDAMKALPPYGGMVEIDLPLPRLHPVMLAGTGSDVGKSVLAAALCRIFRQDGYHPAPFKAQNMALNSYATPEGLEIGRAQAVQAEAAGVPCHTDMNPLLLKPTSDQTTQVVLNGKPIGNRSAYEYFRTEGREELRREVNQAFDRLAARYNPIVMEGAGSISELNLKDIDLVNLPMARHADADVILVADIDRGGVFASAYGSVALQTPEDRKRIKGIIVNKFRGDLRLFESGVKMLEEICGIPVLGVIPYYQDIYIEEEDSVELSLKQRKAMQGKVNVAVVLLRHLSNFTDFNMLEHDERVNLYYTNNVDDLLKADIILLPGSKNTLGDLYELRRNGVAQAILQARRNGATVMGICGGYQMMGQRIADPDGVEGDVCQLPGLGLLPVETVMEGEKVTRQVRFSFLKSDTPDCTGYEIHMGRTSAVEWENMTPLVYLEDGTPDGCVADQKCAGSYIHGILDNPAVIDWLLAPYAEKLTQPALDYAAFKEEQYNKLADHVRKHLNLSLLYQILTKND